MRAWPIEDLLEEMAALGIDKLAQVTPGIMGWDNRYSSDIATSSAAVAAAFARFEVTGPHMEDRLGKLVSMPGITGVRLTPMSPDEQTWFNDGTLDRFFEAAAYQAPLVAIYAPHASREIAALAMRHPDVHVLVDHMNLLYTDPEPFADWRDILDMSAIPNISMKMSNFPEVARDPFPYVSVHSYIREAYEVFGASRLIWGSNFPNCQRACTLAQAVTYFREIDFIDGPDRDMILGGTLRDVLARDADRRGTSG